MILMAVFFLLLLLLQIFTMFAVRPMRFLCVFCAFCSVVFLLLSVFPGFSSSNVSNIQIYPQTHTGHTQMCKITQTRLNRACNTIIPACFIFHHCRIRSNHEKKCSYLCTVVNIFNWIYMVSFDTGKINIIFQVDRRSCVICFRKHFL